MAGRGRMSRHAFDDGRRGYPDFPEEPFERGPGPRPLHAAQFEEEIEMRNADIRRLLADNNRLAEDRHALQREMAAVRDDVQRLKHVINDIQAEREANNREMIEKGLKLETDLRVIGPLKNEALQSRADIKKLTAVKEDLTRQFKNLSHELTKVQAENRQIPVIRTEIDGLHQELVRARTTLEYEKKGNAELFEQRQSMEKNLISMAREIEKLHVELASSEGRPWGVGGPYGMKLANPEGAYPSSFGDKYGLHVATSEKAPLYGASSGSWVAYEKSHIGRR